MLLIQSGDDIKFDKIKANISTSMCICSYTIIIHNTVNYFNRMWLSQFHASFLIH